MKYKIKLSRLSDMSDSDRKDALTALVDAARVKTNGGVSALNARVKKFELRYEMSSEELKRKCAEGKIKETAEIAKWLFLLNTRDAVRSKQTQP
jgi:deoxyribose-phosphate aldolase